MGLEPILPNRKSGVLTSYTNGAFIPLELTLLLTLFVNKALRLLVYAFVAVLTRFELATFRETVGYSSH